jgi:hypothetical protein
MSRPVSDQDDNGGRGRGKAATAGGGRNASIAKSTVLSTALRANPSLSLRASKSACATRGAQKNKPSNQIQKARKQRPKKNQRVKLEELDGQALGVVAGGD